MQIHTLSTRNLADSAQVQDEVVFIMPSTDLAMAQRAATLMAQRSGAAGSVLLVHDLDRMGFIAIVNQVCHHTQSSYVGYAAQDAYAGRQWLALALQALQRPGQHLLGFNDGKWHGAFASFGLARRAWARQNYAGASLFHPGYQRHYADVELSLLARSANAYTYDPRSMLIEVDWHKDTAAVDPQDRALYQRRAAGGFEGRVQSPELLNLVA